MALPGIPLYGKEWLCLQWQQLVGVPKMFHLRLRSQMRDPLNLIGIIPA